MEATSKDILDLISSKLEYDDICSLCKSSSILKKRCDNLWTEKTINKFYFSKEEIIGDPLSFYFGLLNKRGYYWDFSDLFFDFDENGNVKITAENINVTFSGSEEPVDYNFYIPGMQIPINEKIFVAHVFISDSKYNILNLSVVGKNEKIVLKKLIKEIITNYWDDLEDIKNTKIYNEIINLDLNSGIQRKVEIETGSDWKLSPHKIEILYFETLIK